MLVRLVIAFAVSTAALIMLAATADAGSAHIPTRLAQEVPSGDICIDPDIEFPVPCDDDE